MLDEPSLGLALAGAAVILGLIWAERRLATLLRDDSLDPTSPTYSSPRSSSE
mgnify:CR=1 FL=1